MNYSNSINKLITLYETVDRARRKLYTSSLWLATTQGLGYGAFIYENIDKGFTNNSNIGLTS